MTRELLADLTFAGTVIEWRGPAPFVFVVIPPEHSGEIRYAAGLASYGWGVVPVTATIGGVDFDTSLFPRDGGYLLPLKAAVRERAPAAPGETVEARVRIFDSLREPKAGVCASAREVR